VPREIDFLMKQNLWVDSILSLLWRPVTCVSKRFENISNSIS